MEVNANPEAGTVNALNPAFGFNAFGFAPPGFNSPNPAFGLAVTSPEGTLLGTVPGVNALQTSPVAQYAPALNPEQRDNPDNMTVTTPRGVDPDMTTAAPVAGTFGFPASMQSPTMSQAYQSALLGMLADQEMTQQSMESLTNQVSPPAMSMEDALAATVSAMNPAMGVDDTGTDDSGTDNGTTGTQGSNDGATGTTGTSEAGVAAGPGGDEA